MVRLLGVYHSGCAHSIYLQCMWETEGIVGSYSMLSLGVVLSLQSVLSKYWMCVRSRHVG